MAAPREPETESVSALVRSLWQGRLPLWLTYWVFGVGGNMSLLAVLLAIYALAGQGAVASLWTVYLLSLAWFVWIFGGIWRSAGRHRGRRLWAVVARLGVGIGIARMAGEAVLLALITRR
jgi:hypothetical protein